MRNQLSVGSGVVLFLLALVVRDAFAQSPAADDAAMRRRFLADAPAAWKEVEQAIETSEIHETMEWTGVRMKLGGGYAPPRTTKTTAVVQCDRSVPGAKLVVTSESSVTALVYNKSYDFEADAIDGRPFTLALYQSHAQYSAEKNRLAWREFLSHGSLGVSLRLDTEFLDSVCDGPNGKLLAVQAVSMNKKQLCKITIRRTNFTRLGDTTGTAILDPDLHWAVLSYEQKTPLNTVTASIEYNRTTGLPIPTVFKQKIVDIAGVTTDSTTVTFSDYGPTHSKPGEYALDYFGLAAPANN